MIYKCLRRLYYEHAHHTWKNIHCHIFIKSSFWLSIIFINNFFLFFIAHWTINNFGGFFPFSAWCCGNFFHCFSLCVCGTQLDIWRSMPPNASMYKNQKFTKNLFSASMSLVPNPKKKEKKNSYITSNVHCT